MFIDQFTDEAPFLYAAGDTPLPVLLEAPPGIGKTYNIENVVPRRLVNAGLMEQCPVVGFNLNTVEGPDVRGFLFPGKTADGVATARFTRSPIAQAIIDTDSETGILLLDERSQADHLIQKAIAEAIEARRIGDYAIPPGWWIVSCGNRLEDRSGVTRPLMHLRNREAVIQIEPHAPGFIRWAEAVGNLHPMAVAYARWKPGAIQVEHVPIDPKPYPTYRSFTKAANYLASKAGLNPDGTPNLQLPWDVTTMDVVAGLVGPAVAAEMAAYCKVASELPTLKEILASPEGATVPDDNRLDAQYAALSMCVHGATPLNAEPIFKYVLRLRKELQVSACVSLMEKGGGALLNSPSIAKWITENRALISASMS